jgi:hypothetical protein
MMAMWRGVCVDCSDATSFVCEAPFPFPSDEEKRLCVLVKSDLQNFVFLCLADLVHLIDVAVGELL